MGKEVALPKNIRQIGDIQGREKICVEDYVMTCIRKEEQQREKGYLGIFLGDTQETETGVYVFIRGILEAPEASERMPQEGEGQEEGAPAEMTGEARTSEYRRYLEEKQQKYFPGWEVQGCCVIGTYPTERMEQLSEIVPEAGRMIYHLQEQEESLYWRDEENYRRLRGYFVFYEQNRKMQEYLEDVFRENSVESESLPDRAIRAFREKVKEKSVQRRGSMLKLAASFFAITVLVIGAVVVNRLEELRSVRNLFEGEGRAAESRVQREGEEASAGGAAANGAEGWTDVISEAGEEAPAGEASEDTVSEAGEEASAEVVSETGAEASAEAASEAGEEASAGAVSENGAEASAEAAAAAGTEVTAGDSQAETWSTMRESLSQVTNGSGQEAAASYGDDDYQLAGSSSFWEESEEESTEEDTEAAPAASRRTQAAYVIRPGDTLADICARYYGSLDRLSEICEANQITDANMILPGQEILLP